MLSPGRPSQPLADEAEPPDAGADPTPDTRQRILDVALDLFTEQGFDGTSLRQIAEQLGVTKAALYYHFESKDDILMALHMRLHEFGKDRCSRMGEGPVTLELWGELLDEIVDQMLGQRKIFLMHERNQAALEKLHRKDHDAEHEDLQNQFRTVLADTRVPLGGPGAHGRLFRRRVLEPLPLRRRLLLDDQRGIGGTCSAPSSATSSKDDGTGSAGPKQPPG